jgi:hypothetical protein
MVDNLLSMTGYDDDDEDWVGMPPEGRYSADRARPDFWRSQWPPAGGGLLLVIIVVVIVLILR